MRACLVTSCGRTCRPTPPTPRRPTTRRRSSPTPTPTTTSGRPVTNGELARIFHEIGDILEVKGEIPFKTVAYHRAADAIARAPFDVGAAYAAGDRRPIPGVGQAIGDKIVELATTGHMAYLRPPAGGDPGQPRRPAADPGRRAQDRAHRLGGAGDRRPSRTSGRRRRRAALREPQGHLGHAPSSGSSRASSSSSRAPQPAAHPPRPGHLRRPGRRCWRRRPAWAGSSRRARCAAGASRSATSTCWSRPTTPTASCAGSPSSAWSTRSSGRDRRRAASSCCAARRST